MKHLVQQLRLRAAERTLRSITWCEECRKVSTAADRHHHRLDHYHLALSNIQSYRY